MRRGTKKSLRKFRTFAETDKADREFYRNSTGNQRLQILLDLLAAAHGEGRVDRSVFKIRKLADTIRD